MARISFVNGHVFNSSTEAFEEKNVVCENGYVISITTDVPNDGEIVDLGGKYLIPGLIDVHTHGIGGHDFNAATKDEVQKMRMCYAKAGTTSVMATFASQTPDNLVKYICETNENRNKDDGYANIIGVHIEGRYLNPVKKGAHSEKLLEKPRLDELERLTEVMTPTPMHFSLAPELEGAEAFIKQIKKLGGTVGIAHTNATYEESMDAISWGATSFTHTFNAMTSVHHRMPGATVCAMTCDEAYAEVISDGEHLHPAIVNLIYKSKPSDKMVLITDSMAATGEPDGEYSIAGSPVTVVNGRAIILPSGTIAGSTLTMFKAITNMMKFCNLPLEKVIKYATVNPANMVGAKNVGKIEVGYSADFIVINDKIAPKLDGVYIGAKKLEV
ncbi:MAG: N-acetylglucosamine-6-phosphate deacetylase [Ruminococcaceae bacterium]|nr:N-acetylglucosamine-6-phosphate deacetylase [Oscillospiraceae bacterium]